jgi:uncharacterized membrane protein
MNGKERFGIPATAAIAGHPLHPLLVTLPIGFLIGAFLSDIAFYSTGDAFWARASAWLIGAGLVTGVLAAIAGLVDFLGSERIRSLTYAWYHFAGNAIAMILTAINLYLRCQGDMTAVTGGQMLMSILVVLIFAVTGWLGGEMVFRHGAGVIGDEPVE